MGWWLRRKYKREVRERRQAVVVAGGKKANATKGLAAASPLTVFHGVALCCCSAPQFDGTNRFDSPRVVVNGGEVAQR
jgi:hypothetical protein